MSLPVGPGKSPISDASAAPPSAIFKDLINSPSSSEISKLPKENDATITINKPDVEESVSSPTSADSHSGSRGGDSATKLPSKAKPRPSNAAPKASAAAKKASTPKARPSKDAPKAFPAIKKAPKAPKNKPSNSARKASAATKKTSTSKARPYNDAPKASTTAEKAPSAPQATPSDAAPVASITTEEAPTVPNAMPPKTAPTASIATEKAPTAPRAMPSDTVPITSTVTGKASTAAQAPLNTAPIASTATKAPSNLPQSPPSDAMDDSDTEDIESDTAAKKGNIEISSHESASPSSSRSASPTPAASSSHPENPASGPKAQGTGAVKKRGPSKTSSDARPAKRIRSTPQSRAAPRASYNVPSLVGEFTNFTTSIFIVQLGPESGPNCPKFHVHESVLIRSPIFARDIEVAKKAKTLTRQNILAVFPHDPVAFEQMLQYLYKDTFILKSKTSSPLEARLNEIHELFSLAKHYVLPGLQKQVVKAFSQSRMVGKVPVNRFFDWSEDMYYEELNKEGGPFKAFFARVAPGLVKKAKGGDVGQIAKIVGQGGGFAGEIFKAMYAALEQETKKTVLKKEERVSLFEQKVFPEVPAAHDSEEGFVDAYGSSL